MSILKNKLLKTNKILFRKGINKDKQNDLN